MGYQAVKDGIAKLLKVKGFVESNNVFSFEQESDQSTMKKFRIERDEIDFTADGVEFLNTLVRPKFSYKVALGFKLAEQKERMDYDIAQIAVDQLIAYMNNPPNYTAFCIKLEMRTVKSVQVDDHLEVEIKMEVLDDITLS